MQKYIKGVKICSIFMKIFIIISYFGPMIKRLVVITLLFSGLIGLNSCKDTSKKTVYYTVTNITTDNDDGYRFSLRNQKTGHSAFVHYLDLRFKKGDELVMKRTRKEVSFSLKSDSE